MKGSHHIALEDTDTLVYGCQNQDTKQLEIWNSFDHSRVFWVSRHWGSTDISFNHGRRNVWTKIIGSHSHFDYHQFIYHPPYLSTISTRHNDWVFLALPRLQSPWHICSKGIDHGVPSHARQVELNNGPRGSKTSWCIIHIVDGFSTPNQMWIRLAYINLAISHSKSTTFSIPPSVFFSWPHGKTLLYIYPSPQLSPPFKRVPTVVLLGHIVSIRAQNNGRRATTSQFRYDQFLEKNGLTWRFGMCNCGLVSNNAMKRWKYVNLCESALTPPLEAIRFRDQTRKKRYST